MDLKDLYYFPTRLLPDRADALTCDILDFLRQVNEWMLNDPSAVHLNFERFNKVWKESSIQMVHFVLLDWESKEEFY
jgi:hypothetical protein